MDMDSATVTILLLLWKLLFLTAMVYIGIRKWAARHWQFGVRTMLITVTVAAVALVAIRAMILY
jgi:hypothetical protein